MASCSASCILQFTFFFFFNDTATTEIYTLSLHDALPICHGDPAAAGLLPAPAQLGDPLGEPVRSEEHTSELQSRPHLVCRLLLEKKKNKNPVNSITTTNQSPSNTVRIQNIQHNSYVI